MVDRLPLVSVDSGLAEQRRRPSSPSCACPGWCWALVGAMLAVAGGSYQGVFRNPLADPYLLGVAAGAGLGATVAIVTAGRRRRRLGCAAAAFVGALVAVALTYVLGGAPGARRSAATLILAGVAVAAFLTAAQTFLQQRNADTIREVYSWILGRLPRPAGPTCLLLPYAAVAARRPAAPPARARRARGR